MRIVSLIASSTETVCALGFEHALVGRSHECDFPVSVKKLPKCSEPKFEPDGTSYEIDQRVKAILQEGLSIYRVHGELLRDLQPDVIVTQIQCEVCAVSREDVIQAVREWMQMTPPGAPKPNPNVVSLNPNCLEDIWTDTRNIALALGAPKKGEALIASLKSRMQAVVDSVTPLRERLGRAPRVACIEWIDPLMAAGNWVPELLEMLGAENLFGEAGKHSPWMNWDQLLAKDPEVIIVLPCGFDIPKTQQEMRKLTSNPQWSQLRAVQEGKVFLADGNQYFNRPGPRVAESLEIFAEILYGVGLKHRGTGWIPHTT